jgi:DNA-directed RNA polymerase specialized sigma24 family protein
LEREWRALTAGRLREALRVWRRSEPALTRFSNPQQLVAFLWDERVSPLEKDLLLAALLRIAISDALAVRVVMQAMLPGLKGLASRLLHRSPERGGSVLEREELWQVLFCSLLERIASYPLERRPRKIAANLLLDTLHATVAVQKQESAARGLVPLADLREDELVSPEEALEGADVEEPLRRAVAAGAITRSEAGLILETEVDGVALAEVAARLGVSYNAVKVRRQRAERRLLAFLNAEAEIPYIEMDPDGRSKRPSSGAYAPEREHPQAPAEEFPLAELAARATAEPRPGPAGERPAAGGAAASTSSSAGGAPAVVGAAVPRAGASVRGAESSPSGSARPGSRSLA